MITNFGTTITCPCCGEKVDAAVTAEVTGRYRGATRLDPAEEPEVDSFTVTIEATGTDVSETISSSDEESIKEKAVESAGEDEAAAREDAAERRAEAMRDERRFGED